MIEKLKFFSNQNPSLKEIQWIRWDEGLNAKPKLADYARTPDKLVQNQLNDPSIRFYDQNLINILNHCAAKKL